ncbi:helix-turn-helix transcriptional regulator [Nitratireductor sp. XY-223]|uniref:helix-turn-helix transcriptional regulator n=1 Tax=Nitratireductor sp. XY-223 TaxID=2561926 RepID=UPI0010AACFF0|nr:helix-turn-helix transcriptional regulator [Nitratireductor sp. XY-223]
MILGADGYVVCRVNRFASSNSQRITVVLSSVDRQMRKTLATIGPAIEAHMEWSLLPFTWQGEEGAAASGPFVEELSVGDTSVAGVGFPVKLGIMGNGFALFFGSGLDLVGDRVVEFHRDTYRIMRELLTLDVQRISPHQNLNDRELQCLQLAADGHKSEAIAEELALSVHTVNAYLGFAATKLDAVNRIQAIAKAIRLGLIG